MLALGPLDACPLDAGATAPNRPVGIAAAVVVAGVAAMLARVLSVPSLGLPALGERRADPVAARCRQHRQRHGKGDERCAQAEPGVGLRMNRVSVLSLGHRFLLVLLRANSRPSPVGWLSRRGGCSLSAPPAPV